MRGLKEYNIKIVKGNEFMLVLPLKKRSYVACRPLDEDIIVPDLENVLVKINGTEYESTLGIDGVHVRVGADLKEGDYSVILTAEYHGIDIRAAYMNAVTIVSWNNYSDAQQYLQGSPIVLPAAYVLGVLTDEETEELKAELRAEIAAAELAKQAAEAAKAEWEQKAAALDDVAKETTSQQILALSEGAARQGSNTGATNTAIYDLILQEGIERADEYAAEIREIIGDWTI